MPDRIRNLRTISSSVSTTRTRRRKTYFSGLFPIDLSKDLIKEGASDVNALAKLSSKKIKNILGKSPLSPLEVRFHESRLDRFQKLVKAGVKPELINGLTLDLPDKVKLSNSDLNNLKTAKVSSLDDWIAKRDRVKISKNAVENLDKYARLYTLNIDSTTAAKLEGQGYDSATSIAKLSGKEAAALAKKTKIKAEIMFGIVNSAQLKNDLTNRYLAAIDIYIDNGRPKWINDLVINTPAPPCIPCATDESVFSCFSYYVYLVQKTKLSLAELEKKLGGKFDLKSLSPLAKDDLVDDPKAPCAKISVLDYIIRLLQSLLIDLKQSAKSSIDRASFEHLDYATWRAEKIAGIFPETKALWQNDVLTSIGIDEDQGSIFINRDERRPELIAQIELAKESISNAKTIASGNQVSDTEFQTLEDFVDEPFYNDYLHGLALIENIINVDDLIREGVVASQNYQPGIALSKLEEATQQINIIAAEVFTEDSVWYRTRPVDYSDLISISPADRKQHVQDAFGDLMFGRKSIFQPRADKLQLSGLLDDGNIDITSSAFDVDPSFTQNSNGEIEFENVSQNGPARKIKYTRGQGDDNFDDYGIGFLFELNQARADSFSIEIRDQNTTSEFYRLHIQTEGIFEDGNLLGYSDYLVISKVTIGKVEPLNKRIIGPLDGGRSIGSVKNGVEYHISLAVDGPSISGRLVMSSTRVIEVLAEDRSSSIFDKGTFSISVPSNMSGKLWDFKLFENSATGLPPFHSQNQKIRGSNEPRMTLTSDIYNDHFNFGHGMSDNILAGSFVSESIDNDKVKLHGVRRGNNDLFMVFQSGSNKVNPNNINTTFHHSLAQLFFLSYAVIPIRMAQAYFQAGEFERSLELLRLVYDDTDQEPSDGIGTQIYTVFSLPPEAFESSVSPDTRLMRLRLAEAYLAHGDTLFRADTAESKYQACLQFEQVLKLHEANCNCESRVGEITEELLDSVIPSKRLNNPDIRAVLDIIREHGKRLTGLAKLLKDFKSETRKSNDKEFAAAANKLLKKLRSQLDEEDKLDGSFNSNQRIRNPDNELFFSYPAFCIPQNPLRSQQVQQACLMINLLKNCFNILGFKDDLVPPLRFEALLNIASNFAQQAHSAERDLLNFRQLFEQESFALLQAQQNLALSDADVNLEALNVDLAIQDQAIAILQSDQATQAREHYSKLISDGLLPSEESALKTAQAAVIFSGLATVSSSIGGIAGIVSAGAAGSVAGPGGAAAASAAAGVVTAVSGLGSGLFSGLADTSGRLSTVYSMKASNERREQDWQFNELQSTFSAVVASLNVSQSEKRLEIARSRQEITQMRRDFSLDSVNFLSNKFLNGAMYLWMIKTIREQYRIRLDYAITAAFMAERALAFEIQNKRLDIIRFDYFNPSKDGLLGATQLITDLESLKNKQFRLSTRKLQLSKTISLSQLFPVEFAQFKETGIMPFSTSKGSWSKGIVRNQTDNSLLLFDNDFPGHYMRLIKSVKLTVLALVPPIDGIKATLRNNGLSHVVVGPPYASDYEEVTVSRQPDSIALTAPFSSSGLFVLDYNDKFLLPFEGNGVATDWTLELPKAANNFNFETIFDVLVTIDYTALESKDTVLKSGKTFKQSIIEKLGNSSSDDRAYSLRYDFPDAWYHLNNPQNPLPNLEPMEVPLSSVETDFPANQSNKKIERVTVRVSFADGTSEELHVRLKFTPKRRVSPIDGGISKSIDGLISKRKSNADNWDVFQDEEPIGDWLLMLRDDNDPTSFSKIKTLLDEDQIFDLLFVITYKSDLANWPT